MAAEPLVLIHGFSGTAGIWEPLLPALREHHDVTNINLLGHCGGEPFPPGVAPSLNALADGIEADMDKAGIEKAHLVGNSLGGWLALELAHRGRALSVVALSPAGGWEPGSREEKRLKPYFKRTHRLLQFAGPRAEALSKRPGLRKMALRDIASFPERSPPRAAAGMIRGSYECPAFLELLESLSEGGPATDLSGIDVPVRIAWGTKDRIIPLEGYSPRLLRLVPGAELVRLEGLGHCPQSDDPAGVARTILEVTARAEVPATA
jgi:pimeloyl-ACP methyl ester carboxylesterase